MKDKVETNSAVPVTLIERRGAEAALVEWSADGDLKRAVIPSGEIQDGMVLSDVLEMGIPYGLAWENLVILQATPQALGKALRANGIWTYRDLERNQAAAFGVLQSIYGVDLAALIRAAAQTEDSNGNR